MPAISIQRRENLCPTVEKNEETPEAQFLAEGIKHLIFLTKLSIFC